MHHRTSTDSPVDVCFCISWPRKSQRVSSAHIDRFASRCATSVLYSLGQKIHNMHHPRTSTDSHVDVRYPVLYSLGQKITTCIIAHRPMRFATRCAISGFVYLGQKITCIIIAQVGRVTPSQMTSKRHARPSASLRDWLLSIARVVHVITNRL